MMGDIYRLIPKDRYITRDELVAISGQNDRSVRDEINMLRKRPETVIISSSKHAGYKRPESVEELRMCLNESRSRVRDEIEKQRVFERAIREMEAQQRTEQLVFDFAG